MVNVSSRSVAGTIQALGSQLTALTVQCRGLDVPGIFENCTNLKYLTMEGEDCSAPYEVCTDEGKERKVKEEKLTKENRGMSRRENR